MGFTKYHVSASLMEEIWRSLEQHLPLMNLRQFSLTIHLLSKFKIKWQEDVPPSLKEGIPKFVAKNLQNGFLVSSLLRSLGEMEYRWYEDSRVRLAILDAIGEYNV